MHKLAQNQFTVFVQNAEFNIICRLYNKNIAPNVAADTPNDTSGGMVFLLSIITCGIYLLYWMYKAGEKVQAAQAKRGLPSDANSGILYLVLSLVGFSIVSYCLIQSGLNELNKMATPHA